MIFIHRVHLLIWGKGGVGFSHMQSGRCPILWPKSLDQGQPFEAGLPSTREVVHHEGVHLGELVTRGGTKFSSGEGWVGGWGSGALWHW